MGIVIIDCDAEKISDGSHTFADLYDMRDLLFISLMRRFPDRSFRSLRHSDGSARDGMFLAGLHLPSGKQVTVHMREEK